MFATGSQVTVTGVPDRNEPNTCYLGTITFADGTSMDRYGQRQRAADVAVAANRPERLPNGDLNLNGDWAGEQRVMTDRSGISGALVPISVADTLAPGAVPEGGRAFPGSRGTPEAAADDAIRAAWSRPSALPLTDAGRRAAEGFDPSSPDNPRLRCEPTNILFDWGFETFTNRITQDENVIRIQYGTPGIDRTIHLNETQHPASIEPSVAGHSIGRWENDVLVVDTVGFKAGVLSADTSMMHSSGMKVVERFTLDRERMALRREYVATDPAVLHGRVSRRRRRVPGRLALGAAHLQRLELRDGPRHARGAGAGRAAAPAAACGRTAGASAGQAVVDVLEVTAAGTCSQRALSELSVPETDSKVNVQASVSADAKPKQSRAKWWISELISLAIVLAAVTAARSSIADHYYVPIGIDAIHVDGPRSRHRQQDVVRFSYSVDEDRHLRLVDARARRDRRVRFARGRHDAAHQAHRRDRRRPRLGRRRPALDQRRAARRSHRRALRRLARRC